MLKLSVSNQQVVGPFVFAKPYWSLRRMELNNDCNTVEGTASHAWLTIWVRWAAFVGVPWTWIHRAIHDQMCSIGFKSGVFAGHGKTRTCCAANKLRVWWAVWGAPSCWKVATRRLPGPLRRSRSRMSGMTSLVYLAALRLPWMTRRATVLRAAIRPQKYTRGPHFLRGSQHSGIWRSDLFRVTNTRIQSLSQAKIIHRSPLRSSKNVQ